MEMRSHRRSKATRSGAIRNAFDRKGIKTPSLKDVKQ